MEITEGMRFDRGYISPYFITDIKTQKAEFKKPFILLSEKKISAFQDILPSLEIAAQARRPILNKLRGQLSVCAVKAPGFGDNRQSILGDLAVLSGGTVFPDDIDVKLDQVTPDLLGSTGSITITKEDTIFNGAGSKDAIAARREQIRSVLNDVTTPEFDKIKLQERLAKLSGGVAVIKVGGSSEVEVGEKKDRYDDALNATRASVEEGIVPGGGVALLKASLALTPESVVTSNFDQSLGVTAIKNALQRPARTIVENAGEEGSVIVGQILERRGDKFGWGSDASKGEFTDMIARGIVDPPKVVRTALVDASGFASLLTMSEARIVEAPEEKGPTVPGGMGGMGGTGGMEAWVEWAASELRFPLFDLHLLHSIYRWILFPFYKCRNCVYALKMLIPAHE
ncbi:unnamed protein product [Rhizoctonia solani]|uniref:Uncharacterized protein n=1 Tax=Rhizoctonia solani TaxID=456999 RepID=A0A8H3CZX6_9AGAM|nr:unnamed protein product [Rhizoctonia solani]